MRRVIRTPGLMLVAGLVFVAVAVFGIIQRGLSTRVAPTRVEAVLARGMRYLATPGSVRERRNPVEYTAQVREEAIEHFAEHCASCHANDGSGDTDMGRSFYPPAPDMRAAATQGLSDGELFSIIENGIRLTGMPAWGNGTAEGERSSWALVHFIRSLVSLGPEDVSRMEAMNPRTPRELREAEDARRFLSGGDPAPAAGPAHEEGHR